MKIFIDESGVFKALDGRKSRVSGVGALILRADTSESLFEEFRLLSRRWERDGREIKGSQLDEGQISKVLKLLARYDAILVPEVIDMGLHHDARVLEFKRAQAEMVMAGLPATYSEGQRAYLQGIKDGLLGLPNQLFVQVLIVTKVIEQTLELGTMYWSQRKPAELGEFLWVVDAKDSARTRLEELWTFLVMPFIHARSIKKPMNMIVTGDYSCFERFVHSDIPLRPPEATNPLEDFDGGSDVRMLLRDMSFINSAEHPGLRLVDIALSALTRALNGTLQKSGWTTLGELLIYAKPQSVGFTMLSGNEHRPLPRHTEVVRHLEESSKTMIKRSRHRESLLGSPRVEETPLS